MNIDNYLKQLTVDIDNQKLQETILNKSAKTTTFDFKIKNMTQTNTTQVSSFLKNDIIDKLNRLVDSVTAMRVYSFLTSNNLMDTFLKSYEYLLNYKNYNVMTYNDIINYILSYQSSSKGMLDFLKEDLKEKLKSKADIVQLKQLNKITTNANMKNKIKIASQKIPTQEKINKVQNIDILQQMINDADFLPDKEQIDEIFNRIQTRRTKPEIKEAKLMGFEDIQSLENKGSRSKASKNNLKMKRENEREFEKNILYSKIEEDKRIRESKLMGFEDIRRLEKNIESQYPMEYSEKVTTEYETKILSKNKFDDPEYEEDLKQNYINKYNIGVKNEIQIDNKELDIIMEELNKKSQFEEQEESFQSLSQETNITEEELSQELENMSQEFEDIMTPTKSQEVIETPFETFDLKNYEFKGKLKCTFTIGS